MAVKYVKEFTFPKSPPRPTIPGYARGGHVSTPDRYASGGSTTPDRYKDGGHWIKGAIKHPGALHKELGIAQGKKIPAKTLAKAAGKGGKLGQRARLAETLKGMRHAEGGSSTPDRYASGGHAKGCTCKMCSGGMAHKEGGSIGTADGLVKMGRKSAWNPDDASSPGSPKRTPPGQKETNQAASRSAFAHEGRGTPPATQQTGDVERMAGYSDFRKGGRVHKKAGGGSGDRFETSDGSGETHRDTSGTSARGEGDGKEYKSGGRIKNLGHYAHGGKVQATRSEVKSGHPASVKVPSKVTPGPRSTAKPTDGSAATRHEVRSGTPAMAMGGLSRGANPKRNAAIHAKMAKAQKIGALGALAGALSGNQMPKQGGMAPPGMAPGMGAPPGGQMGAMAPQAPTMGGGPPMMAAGGNVRHVFVHHMSHGKR